MGRGCSLKEGPEEGKGASKSPPEGGTCIENRATVGINQRGGKRGRRELYRKRVRGQIFRGPRYSFSVKAIYPRNLNQGEGGFECFSVRWRGGRGKEYRGG